MRPFSACDKLKLIKCALEGEKVTKICQQTGVSRKTFYSWLKKYKSSKTNIVHLALSDKRFKKIFSFKTLDQKEKLLIINKGLAKEASVSEICTNYQISRKTFYKWLKRYQERGENGLYDLRPKGKDHYRAISKETEEIVLQYIAQNPTLSVHRLTRELDFIGHHGIQNLLLHQDLNTIAKRQLFAQGYITQPEIAPVPEYEVAARPTGARWRWLFAPFATIPKFVVRTPATWPLAIPLFLLVLYIFEFDKLLRPAMFFPAVALFFGMMFFFYSLKYYISLIFVMAFQGQSLPSSERQQNQEVCESKFGKFFAKLLGSNTTRTTAIAQNLDKVTLSRYPFVSVHLPLYNERRVVERLLNAVTSLDWPNFEVIVIDDSTDETTEMVKQQLTTDRRQLTKIFSSDELSIFESTKVGGPTVKLIHRSSRVGFKGAALQRALENTDSRAEYICVFDADFVPFPDTLQQFVKTFQVLNANETRMKIPRMDANISINSHNLNSPTNSHNIAAVQGYQWHVLNKSENWVTRGVRTEYAGSYVVERAGIELYGGLKQIAGSVFCIRADVIRKFGWGTSITEDFELTLRLYEAGYKVAFTPYIQAPAEAVSTVRRLIRQRMRWAEGHTYNVRKMYKKLLATKAMTGREKFEFLYLGPYYLQATFFIFGTLAWFIAETVVHAQLPFWTAAWGWSLVFVNFLSLPMMNLVGLFLEESDERDYLGIASFVLLSYLLVPFQAYAATKALFEKEEGPWFRTPKTGRITDVIGKSTFYRWIERLKLWPKPAVAMRMDANYGRINANPSTRLRTSERIPAFIPVSSFNPLSGYKIRAKRLPFVARGTIAGLLITVIFFNFLAFLPPVNEAQAVGTPKIEQQINIMDKEYYTNLASYDPTDNSLGLINWDFTKYDGTVDLYFEAILAQRAATGRFSSMDCPTADDCKIVFYENVNQDLKFRDCGDATCSTGTTTTIDSTGDVGNYLSAINCVTATDCRIAYYDATNMDLKYADCNDAACTAPTITIIDSTNDVGRYGIDIDCQSSTTCKIAYDYATGSDLKFAAYVGSGGSNCASSAWTCTAPDSTGSVGYAVSLDCSQGEADCRIAYRDYTNSTLKYADCNDSTCSSPALTAIGPAYVLGVPEYSIDCSQGGTNCKIAYYGGTADMFFSAYVGSGGTGCTSSAWTCTAIDTLGDAGRYASLDCSSSATDCKITYERVNNSLGYLIFRDCDNATCSTGTVTTVDKSDAMVGGYTGNFTSVDCSHTAGGADCKIAYYEDANSSLKFYDCGNGICSSGSASFIGNDGDVGQYAAIDCGAGATDCKIVYYDAAYQALRFVDCNDATCSTRTETLLDGFSGCAATGCDPNADVGQYPSISCYQSGYCRITYYDATNGDLKFIACNDSVACSSTDDVITADSTGDVGKYSSIDCAYGNECAFAYYDVTNTALKKGMYYGGFIIDVETLDGASGCTLDSCSTSAAVGKYASLDWALYYPGEINVSYLDDNSGDGNLKVAYCHLSYDVAYECNVGSSYGVSTVESSNDVGYYTSIYCPNYTDCKITHYDETNDELRFIDCGNTKCDSGNTARLLDGSVSCTLSNAGGDGCSTNSVGKYSSIYCPSATTCKISYYDETSGSLKYGACADAICGNGGYTKVVESNNQVGQYSSINCYGGADDCKIAYYSGGARDLRFYDCVNANVCVTGTATLVSNGTAIARAALYTDSGSMVNGSEVTVTTPNYTRVRSSSLNVYSDDYTVRVRSFQSNYTYIKAARIIITQVGAVDGSINKTETQVDIGAAEVAGATYSQLTNAKVYCYDSTSTSTNCAAASPSRFSPTPTASFEASGNGGPAISAGFRQKLDIINQEYTNPNTTDSPIDNSLGLVDYDANSYSGTVTAYFEAVILNTNSNTTTATLYSEAGSAVSGSAVTTTATIYTRVHSSSITLTDDTNYTVRIKTSDIAGTAKIKAARIIILQQPGSGNNLTATENQIELGDNQSGTDISYVYLTDKKIYYYDSSKFNPAPTAIFQATAKNTSGDATQIRLYDITNGDITGLIASFSTNWASYEDSTVSLTSGHEYAVQVNCADIGGGGCTWSIANAKLVLRQSGTVTAFESIDTMVNSLATDTDSTYTNQDYLLLYWGQTDPQVAPYGANVAYFFEATMKTSAGTGYAQLYNRLSASAISGSELATSSPTYERKRSGDLTSQLMTPCVIEGSSGITAMDTQGKNSAASGNTTSISNSWLIYQVSNVQTTGAEGCARLYNATQSQAVSGSDVNIVGGSTSRARSGSITLTAGNAYLVQTKKASYQTNGSNIVNAKIILDQSDNNGVSALETVQQYTNRNAGARATDFSAYQSIEYMNDFNSSNISGSKTYYYEVMMYITTAKNGSGTAASQLSTGMGINTTTSATLIRLRSSLTEPSNQELDAQVMCNACTGTGTNVTLGNAWLIIQMQSIPVPEFAVFALPGMLFLPRIVRWIKERRKKAIGTRPVGNSRTVKALGNRSVGNRVIGALGIRQ